MKIHHEHISNLCKDNVPKRIGAYVITHSHDNIYAEKYVGVTKNLYKRMCGHCNKEIICIDLFITDDIILAESLERILIELINPSTNKLIYPLSDKDKHIMEELLENIEIKKVILNNTIQIGYRFLKCIKFDEKIKEIKFVMRKVQELLGGTITVSIPIEYGFKKGEHVKVEQLDDNTVKITKVI